MGESSAAWLPHPPFFSRSLSRLPTFLSQKRPEIPLLPLATPLPTPRSYRDEHRNVPHPSTRRSVSSGRRNSSTRNYITRDSGFSKTRSWEGRGLLVWEALPGLRAAPPSTPPRNIGWQGGSSGGVRGKFLSGPFPSGVNGWHVRGLETEEDTLTAVREEATWGCSGGWSGALRRRYPRSWRLNTRAGPEGRAP